MNRRGFLKKAVGAVGAVALGSSILPKAVEASNPTPTITISEIKGGEGGYIVPTDYEALIRRDLAESLALKIDKEVLGGLNHGPSKIIGKTGKVTLDGSKLTANVRRLG